MEKNLVSVVFPTMNRKEDLIKCIKSIKANTYKKIEIIIADNGSTDDSKEAIKKMFPDVILLESGLNLGSPIAINNCIEKSKGEFIFRLDDDVIIEKDTIEKMIKILKSDKKIGAVSCLCFYTEDPNILRATGMSINMFTGKTKIYDRNKKYNGEFNKKLIEREAAGGGSLLVRRSTYDEIDLYPEEYFLMYEDIDWCLRLRKAGYKIVVVGSSKLYHTKKGGLSQKESPFRVYLINRSQVLFMKRNAGWKNIIFFPYLFTFLYPAKALRFLFKKNIPAMKSLTKGIFDALFNEKIFVYTKDGKQVPYLKK